MDLIPCLFALACQFLVLKVQLTLHSCNQRHTVLSTHQPYLACMKDVLTANSNESLFKHGLCIFKPTLRELPLLFIPWLVSVQFAAALCIHKPEAYNLPSCLHKQEWKAVFSSSRTFCFLYYTILTFHHVKNTFTASPMMVTTLISTHFQVCLLYFSSMITAHKT